MGTDDHFYGAWKGGDAKHGGGPMPPEGGHEDPVKWKGDLQGLADYQIESAVNLSLRKAEGDIGKLSAAEQRQVALVDRLMAAQPGLKAPLTVHRGISPEEKAQLGTKSGQFYHGFVSTSHDPKRAASYGHTRGGGVIAVLVPEGTRVLDTTALALSKDLGGAEVVLPRGGFIRRASDGSFRFFPSRRFREAKGGEDHFYGAWSGGKAASGGGPVGPAEEWMAKAAADHEAAFGSKPQTSAATKASIRSALTRGERSFTAGSLSAADKALVTSWKTGNSNLLRDPRMAALVDAGRVTRPITVYRAGTRSEGGLSEFTLRASWAAGLAKSEGRPLVAVRLKSGDKALFIPHATTSHLGEVGVLLPSGRLIGSREAKSDDDHFYGAWHGGARGSGGGPGRLPTKAARTADLASKIGAANVGKPGVPPKLAAVVQAKAKALGVKPNPVPTAPVTRAAPPKGGLHAAGARVKGQTIETSNQWPTKTPAQFRDRAANYYGVPLSHKAEPGAVLAPDGSHLHVTAGGEHGWYDTRGRLQAYAMLDGPYINAVEINPAKRGKGIATAFYDHIQDHTPTNLYDAIGTSHSFTAGGKAFAEKWLQHRAAIEGVTLSEAADGKAGVIMAWTHVRSAPVVDAPGKGVFDMDDEPVPAQPRKRAKPKGPQQGSMVTVNVGEAAKHDLHPVPHGDGYACLHCGKKLKRHRGAKLGFVHTRYVVMPPLPVTPPPTPPPAPAAPREAKGADDHFYGAWKGGDEQHGGHPAGGSAGQQRRVAKNPSGRYLRMNDAQVARADAAHQRAVARQLAKDAAAAAASQKRTAGMWVTSPSGGERLTLAKPIEGTYGGKTVAIDRFYSRSEKLWIVHGVDEHGNQIGDAQYAVRRDDIGRAVRDVKSAALKESAAAGLLEARFREAFPPRPGVVVNVRGTPNPMPNRGAAGVTPQQLAKAHAAMQIAAQPPGPLPTPPAVPLDPLAPTSQWSFDTKDITLGASDPVDWYVDFDFPPIVTAEVGVTIDAITKVATLMPSGNPEGTRLILQLALTALGVNDVDQMIDRLLPAPLAGADGQPLAHPLPGQIPPELATGQAPAPSLLGPGQMVGQQAVPPPGKGQPLAEGVRRLLSEVRVMADAFAED